MRHDSFFRYIFRHVRVIGLLCCMGLATMGLVTAQVYAAPPNPPPTPGGGVSNPYSPAYGHAYRHGAVPTRETHAQMKAWEASQAATSSNNLNYGGGVGGVGVTTGHAQVYLVFYGSQWGSSSTDSNGNMTLSGDSLGMAPRLQQLMKGLGNNGELWSGVMTQYCDGVATGSQTCPGSSAHVGYPYGGALSGL